jgi:hypothetical protein
MKISTLAALTLLVHSASAQTSDSIALRSLKNRELNMPCKKYNENDMTDVPAVHGLHLELNTGASMYTGHLSALQRIPEPAVGFQVGGRTNKFSYDFGCNLHWATAPQSFTMYRGDSLYSTRYTGAGYLGLDFGYQLYRNNRQELDAFAGIGYAVFDVRYDSTQSFSYHSPDINAGLGYRYYFRHRDFGDRETFTYLALQAKYRFLFYDNPAATPINGNSLSLTLAIGGYTTARPGNMSSGFGRGFMDALNR